MDGSDHDCREESLYTTAEDLVPLCSSPLAVRENRVNRRLSSVSPWSQLVAVDAGIALL